MNAPVRCLSVLLVALLLVGCGATTPTPTTKPAASAATAAPAATAASGAAPKPAAPQPTAAPPKPAASGPAVAAPKDVKPTTATNVEYLAGEPMTRLLTAKKGAVKAGGPIDVPVITWGGDVATIHANGGRTTGQGSIFQRKGLNVRLVREDDFLRAVDKVAAGDTPYLRGTVDQIASASEALADRGIDMVVVYQLTWSTGGDTIVVRGDQVKSIAELKGRYVATQRFGPHMLYLATVLRDAGLGVGDVKIRWLRELTLPPYDTKGVAVDPMTALQRDADLAAATVISPDMLALTSGGAVGTGAESSVKGARLLLSTKTAGRVVADVYAVRKDYLDANRAEVQGFVNGLMQAQEEVVDLFNKRDQRATEYQALLRTSAEILRDSPQAAADVDGLLQDCTFVGFAGNVQFFANPTNPRAFGVLTGEAQDALIGFGLLSRKIPLPPAGWDYSQLAQGLRDTAGVAEARFDPARVERATKEREARGTAAEGVLFEFEIGFAPNQNQFSVDQYRPEFERVIKLASTYPGALVLVEGHSDPSQYLKLQSERAQPIVLENTKRAAKNLSLARAIAVRESLISFAKAQNLTLDPTQFTVVGAGIDRPKVERPTSEKDAEANRRVVFQIVQIEAELEKFAPAGPTPGPGR